MLEAICLRNTTRYIVSISGKIILVTHDYNWAKEIEDDIVKRNITDKKYNVILGRKK